MSSADRSIRIIKRGLPNVAIGEDTRLKTDAEIKREIWSTIRSWVDHQREAKKSRTHEAAFLEEGLTQVR